MNKDRVDLKELYQGYLARKKFPKQKNCPSSADLIRSFEHSASSRQKKMIIDHLSECYLCREEFTITAKLQGIDLSTLDLDSRHILAIEVEQGEGTTVPSFWRHAGAAMGLLLVIASLIFIIRQSDHSDAIRAQETHVILLEPKANRVLSMEFLFRWARYLDAEYYVLELFDEALIPVWRSDRIYDLKVPIPSNVFDRFIPGRSYFWMVTAYAVYGKAGESALARFIVRR